MLAIVSRATSCQVLPGRPICYHCMDFNIYLNCLSLCFPKSSLIPIFIVLLFTFTHVAIKSIRMEKLMDEKDLVHIHRAIEIMFFLNHSYIITIYEGTHISNKEKIVMEYASRGDLYDYISEKQRISKRDARHLFRQIVSAVHYCHRNGIVHRNFQLENILLDGNANIKIADFGLSNLYRGDEYLQMFVEALWARGGYGSMPFDGHNHKNLMLMVKPERRATIEEIAGHWWLNCGYQNPLLAERETATLVQQVRRPLHPYSSLEAQPELTVGCVETPSPYWRTAPGALPAAVSWERKESNISQTMHYATTAWPSKDILRRRGSLKQKALREAPTPAIEEPTKDFDISTPAQPPHVALLPCKGILKKPANPPHRKGILKCHSKFSSCCLQEFGSLDQLAASLARGGTRAQPRGEISEDSILSSESLTSWICLTDWDQWRHSWR
uniref:non-specific serine/threonine protein kinase n=1 Tax=Hucho hucho TaxID=62062 RepID=A0A4W5K9H9_9TELE